jgi:gamma-glutamyl-gamma-aminobutyrate hydrolase PuuD
MSGIHELLDVLVEEEDSIIEAIASDSFGIKWEPACNFARSDTRHRLY